MADDGFDAIISNAGLSDLENLADNLTVVSIKSLHETLAILNQSAMIVAHYLIDALDALASKEDPPPFTQDALTYIQQLTAAAEGFCEEVTFYDDDDEDSV